MYTTNLIDAIKLPFRKEKELYRSFYKMLGFYPRNISYYQEALMHRSMAARSQKGRPLNNERLEFLGDAILDAVVGDIVFRHFQRKSEGFLTNTRSKVVQRESLGQLATMIGLDKLVHSQSFTQCHNSYMGGNAFEAMIGAIYMDRGYDYCMRFMEDKVIGHLINLDKIAYKEVNFKSKLLELSQKYRLTLDYELLSQERDADGAPIFSSRVLVQGEQMGVGKGYSKKESQQIASRKALARIRRDRKVLDSLIQSKTNTEDELN